LVWTYGESSQERARRRMIAIAIGGGPGTAVAAAPAIAGLVSRLARELAP
jgi:hypothetical protein